MRVRTRTAEMYLCANPHQTIHLHRPGVVQPNCADERTEERQTHDVNTAPLHRWKSGAQLRPKCARNT
eukprot:scaffold8455_cov325-Pinguiococcus_pyrenoidosus.AAC.1